MSLQVHLESEGTGRAAYHLERLALRAEDVMPVWRELNALFHADEAFRFEAQGLPSWKELADATLARKASLGQPMEIMRATETLWRSLTSGSDGGGISAMRPGRISFGTDVPYARFHQYGTKKMPKRKVVGITPATRRRMITVLSEYITGTP